MYIRHILPEPEQGVMPLNPLQGALTGIMNIAFHLALHQARNRHQVELWCPSEDGSRHERIVEGVTMRWIPLWGRARLPHYDLRWFLPLLLSNFYAPRVDILHVHNNPYLLVHTRARRAVLHVHNSPLRGSRVYDLFMRRTQRVICISDFIRAEVAQAMPYPPDQLTTIYNAIDISAFSRESAAPTREHLCAKYGLDADALVVLFSGRVVPEKGFHVLLEAWGRVLQAQPSHKLTLAVAGTTRLGLGTALETDDVAFKTQWSALEAYEHRVQQMAHALPVQSVRFFGSLNREQIGGFYRMGDIFVCPSTWQEPFGLVNVEAMAAGVPVIASAVGGIPEVVKHEFNGLLVPPDDPDALAQALIRLIQDEPLRRQMGANAQTFAQEFDWATIAKQVDEVYESL